MSLPPLLTHPRASKSMSVVDVYLCGWTPTCFNVNNWHQHVVSIFSVVDLQNLLCSVYIYLRSNSPTDINQSLSAASVSASSTVNGVGVIASALKLPMSLKQQIFTEMGHGAGMNNWVIWYMLLWKMTTEVVELSMRMVSFHSFLYLYQRCSMVLLDIYQHSPIINHPVL